MSDTLASLNHKISSARDLQSVVRTMKAIAASSLVQFDQAIAALVEYYKTVELGLGVCLRQESQHAPYPFIQKKAQGATVCIVFGSDQGLVGQFNETIAQFAAQTLTKNSPKEVIVWGIGERLQANLQKTIGKPAKSFELPNGMGAVSTMVRQILIELEKLREQGAMKEVYLFFHQSQNGAGFTPNSQRLLPLDQTWQKNLTNKQWPTHMPPQILNTHSKTLKAFVHEYLFVSLFRACVESMVSENASRLQAMQRAEKNIDELLQDLNQNFHRLRQNSIDEELFDVVSGFEALTGKNKTNHE